jgi:hypothetical protein
MRQAGLNAVLWGAFALLILTGSYVMLRACDLGFAPLFGATAYAAPIPDDKLAAEREREAHLRSSIHTEEIRLALLPACPNPLPPEPKPIALEPKPHPPEPKPKPDPQIVQKFEVPKKIEELKGCWQSVRGDIDMVTDDAEQRPTGKARFCYCFGSNGRGKVQILYTDGDICRAGPIARISRDHVFMHHDNVSCRQHGLYVASDITCGNDQSDQTSCEITNLNKKRTKITEQFIRVSDEHCSWGG